MCTGDHNQFASRGMDAQIERTPKGEFSGWDPHEARAKRFGNGNRPIGRTRIDEDGLDILERLLPDALE